MYSKIDCSIIMKKKTFQCATICDSSVGLVDSSEPNGHEFKPY